MNKYPFVLCFLLFSAFAQGAPRGEWFRNLTLENAVRASDLIVAVQVSDVTEIKLMRGGKGESSMYQYKFKPARVLKGVFAREELSVGSSDLGVFRLEDMKAIKKGAFMLMFLGRSDLGYCNVNRVEEGMLSQSMPPLADAQDPLLDAVRTLLAVNAEVDRGKRASLLIGAVNKADGPGVVALLKSLEARSLLAGQDPAVAGAVTKHLTSNSPAVREAAARALSSIIAADSQEHAALRESAVANATRALKLADPSTLSRQAMFRLLGVAGQATTGDGEAMKQLGASPAAGNFPNMVERAAQLRALGSLGSKAPGAGAAVESWYSLVPLDDAGELAAAAEYALTQVSPGKAVELLKARLNEKIAAGFSARSEIEALGYLPPETVVPVIVEISKMALKSEEESALATTSWRLVQEKPDDRLVDPLALLLAPDNPSRSMAMNALLKIDTDAAARAIQPHLREEQNLAEKLLMSGMLGRHGLRDGYVFAIEHVSEASVLERAVSALAAIKEPEAIVRLKEILETSNDVGWNTAAVRGLGAMGAQDMATKILGLTDNLRNPLATAALVALADLGEIKVIPRLREGLDSRNERVVMASARAAGKLLARPGINDPDVRDKLLGLLGDADANVESRTAALEALVEIKDDRLDKVLTAIIREAALENSGLLNRAEGLVRIRKVKLS